MNKRLFKTKAESQYLAVALASMIARYGFIKHMDLLSSQYHMTIPKGASNIVDDFAYQFVKKYGKLPKIC